MEQTLRRWKRWSRAYLSVQKARGVAEETHGSPLHTPRDETDGPGGHDLLIQTLDERFPEKASHDKIGRVLDNIFELKLVKGESTATFTG